MRACIQPVTGCFYVPAIPKNVVQYRMGQRPSNDDCNVKQLVKEVKRFGVLSIINGGVLIVVGIPES